MENENLNKIYELLEHQEKQMFYEYHKDMEIKKNIIKNAMNKIFTLKILGESLSDDIILLGDMVMLEIDYGENDIETINQILVISSDNDNELSLYSPIGSAVFAQNVGEKVNVLLPNGENAIVTILGKNKNLFKEEQDNVMSK